jgi:hypothetical protein
MRDGIISNNIIRIWAIILEYREGYHRRCPSAGIPISEGIGETPFNHEEKAFKGTNKRQWVYFGWECPSFEWNTMVHMERRRGCVDGMPVCQVAEQN